MKGLKIVFLILVVCLSFLGGGGYYYFSTQREILDWPVTQVVDCPKLGTLATGETYSGGICTAQAIPQARSTAVYWKAHGIKYPLAGGGVVNQDTLIYKLAPTDWSKYIEFVVNDLHEFWGGQLNRLGLSFPQPQIVVLDAEQLKNYPGVEQFTDKRYDRIFYDRQNNIIVVPALSAWGGYLPEPAKASSDQITALIAFAYAKSVQSQLGMLNIATREDLDLHAYYLTGVYFYSRFPNVRADSIPHFGSRAYFLKGWREGNLSDPANLNSRFP